MKVLILKRLFQNKILPLDVTNDFSFPSHNAKIISVCSQLNSPVWYFPGTGSVSSELHCSSNGSWQQHLPWGGMRAGLTAPHYPLLEASLAPQAGLLTLPTQYLFSPAPGLPPTSLSKTITVHKAGDSRLLETKYKVRHHE